MKQKKKGMQDMHEVTKNDEVIELRDDDIQLTSGGGYRKIGGYIFNGRHYIFEFLDDNGNVIETKVYMNEHDASYHDRD